MSLTCFIDVSRIHYFRQLSCHPSLSFVHIIFFPFFRCVLFTSVYCVILFTFSFNLGPLYFLISYEIYITFYIKCFALFQFHFYTYLPGRVRESYAAPTHIGRGWEGGGGIPYLRQLILCTI